MDQYMRIIMRYDSKICHFKSFHYLACTCMTPILDTIDESLHLLGSR